MKIADYISTVAAACVFIGYISAQLVQHLEPVYQMTARMAA